MIVLVLHWIDGGTGHVQAFGPWTPADDDAHLDQIRDFIGRWKTATGCEPATTTLHLLTPPDGGLDCGA